jgi:hypothetical protein
MFLTGGEAMSDTRSHFDGCETIHFDCALKRITDLEHLLGASIARGGQLIGECAELRKDAERYRWIRTAGAWESEIGMEGLSENPSLFDAAVDAALGEKP